jgi:peptidoglycan/LPS O-acetylase OafA/YrhL
MSTQANPDSSVTGTEPVADADAATIAHGGIDRASIDRTIAKPAPSTITRSDESAARYTPPPAIAALTGIRAVAAVWAVMHHYRDFFFQLFPSMRPLLAPLAFGGYLSLEAFFVLSGFIMAYNYATRVHTKAEYRRYLWARFARVYPVHFVTLLMMLVFVLVLGPDPYFRSDFGNWWANLFLYQAFPGWCSVNVPAWSISCDAVAYLVFPLLVWSALKLTPRMALAWSVAVLLAGITGIWLNGYQEPSLNMPIYYPIIWLRVGTEFTVGVLLWKWWAAKPRGSARWDVTAAICFVVTFLWCYAVPATSPATFFALPFITLFVLSCASATGWIGRFLSSRPLQWGGRVSYSLYLTHYIVLLLFKHLLPWENYIDAPILVRVVLVLLIIPWVLGPAALVYHYVEEPARKVLLRRSRRRSRAAGG